MKTTPAASQEILSQHYGQLVGVQEPWKVEKVNLDIPGKRVEVHLEHGSNATFVCPTCRQVCGIHDHAPERRWRHLDTMQFETIIVARLVWVNCSDHGVHTVKVPWAEKSSRFTLLFEAFAIRVIEACRSYAQAQKLLGLDWDSLQTIVERAVTRGLARRNLEGIETIGMDEKSFGRGQNYVSVLTDLKQDRILEVTPGNDTQSGCALLETLSHEQRQNIKAAAIDMSGGFAAAAHIQIPQAALVHDHFHVSKILNNALDKVRREEHRQLLQQNDPTLTGTRYLWLYDPRHLSKEQEESFSQVVAQKLKTARAWVLKESFIGLWSQKSVKRGQQYFTQWYARTMRSRLEPMKKAARTFKAHLTGLLNYLVYPITNAATEGLNSRIQALKSNARGFQNFAHYRCRILFHFGKLDLMPTHEIS